MKSRLLIKTVFEYKPILRAAFRQTRVGQRRSSENVKSVRRQSLGCDSSRLRECLERQGKAEGR
jgi:hypothetical protein